VKSSFNKKIFVFMLLMGGFTLVAFTIGRQMGKSEAPVPTRGRSSKKSHSKKGSGNKGK
jgi:hypothetical protein